MLSHVVKMFITSGLQRRCMPEPRCFPPPEDMAEVELEVTQAMSLLVLTCTLRLDGHSTVARMDWVPSYFGTGNRHVLHTLEPKDLPFTSEIT